MGVCMTCITNLAARDAPRRLGRECQRCHARHRGSGASGRKSISRCDIQLVYIFSISFPPRVPSIRRYTVVDIQPNIVEKSSGVAQNMITTCISEGDITGVYRCASNTLNQCANFLLQTLKAVYQNGGSIMNNNAVNVFVNSQNSCDAY
jgi:hypothetical protein